MKKTFPLLALLLVILTACPRKDKEIDTDKTDRKVGYIFYSEFINNFNTSLFQTFSRFKAEGVTDLIVDLRNNHGGDLAAASYLASLIAPRSAVQNKSVFLQLDFNTFLNGRFGNDRKYYLGESSGASDPLNANLDLKTVYIIATDDSYSASEALTFCLKPYMNVVHIGDSTGGKFTASMTVTAYDNFGGKTNTIYDASKLSASAKDSLKNWAMQPIVAIYSDSKNNNFSGIGTLVPTVRVASRENDPSSYVPLGDSTDYLIATALAQIKGTAVSALAPTTPRGVTGGIKSAKLFSRKDNLLTQGAVIAPIKGAAQGAIATAAINTVSQFVYDGMSVFYRWSDYITSQKPTTADSNPEAYFYKILYPLDTQHGWSWITDDAASLLADFAGTPLAFGWGLSYYWTDASQTRIIAVVKYVYPNTPASNAGIQRGNVITLINGSNITDVSTDNGYYLKLSGGNPLNVTVASASGGNSRSVNITPTTISTNPVLKEALYTLKK